jgi:hypothetical protein
MERMKTNSQAAIVFCSGKLACPCVLLFGSWSSSSIHKCAWSTFVPIHNVYVLQHCSETHVIFTIVVIFFGECFFVHGFLLFMIIFFCLGLNFVHVCFHTCWRVIVVKVKINSHAIIVFFLGVLACPFVLFILDHGILLLFMNVNGQFKCF